MWLSWLLRLSVKINFSCDFRGYLGYLGYRGYPGYRVYSGYRGYHGYRGYCDYPKKIIFHVIFVVIMVIV